VIAGATAVGGGDLIVVSDVEFVVLLLVESVTIGSAYAVPTTTIAIAANSFFIFCSLGCLHIKYHKKQHKNH
jgi:hypothetical protein